MLVKGKCRLNSKLFHYEKRNAIRQGVFFVFMLLKIAPTLLKQIFTYMNNPDRKDCLTTDFLFL